MRSRDDDWARQGTGKETTRLFKVKSSGLRGLARNEQGNPMCSFERACLGFHASNWEGVSRTPVNSTSISQEWGPYTTQSSVVLNPDLFFGAKC